MHIHQTHHGTERARTRENESERARVRENTNRNDRVLSASRNAANSIAVAKREEKEFAKKKGDGGTAGFDKATVAGGGGCAWSTDGRERAPKAADPLSRALSPRRVTAMRVVCISVGWGVVFLAFFGRFFFPLSLSLARRLHCIQLNRSREYWGYGVVFWGGRHRCSLCVNCGRQIVRCELSFFSNQCLLISHDERNKIANRKKTTKGSLFSRPSVSLAASSTKGHTHRASFWVAVFFCGSSLSCSRNGVPLLFFFGRLVGFGFTP